MKTIGFIDAGMLRPAVIASRVCLGQEERFDWLKFKRFLDYNSGGEIFDVHYFDAIPSEPSEGRDKFHEFLESPNMAFSLHFSSLRKKTHSCPHCKGEFSTDHQKGVDVALSFFILKLAPVCDQLLLCSGDGEFVSICDYLRNSLGKRITVMGWKDSIAPNLKQIANSVIYLEDHADKFIGDKSDLGRELSSFYLK